jgi:hypothetical protein
MAIIGFIITILYIIWLNKLISFGVKTATRIAIASEASAANTALLVQMAQARSSVPPPLPTSHVGYDVVARELGL